MSEVVPTHGKIDPEVERQRLAKLYATMNDLGLAEVAGEPTARSEWAFEAVRDEMTKRGLDWGQRRAGDSSRGSIGENG